MKRFSLSRGAADSELPIAFIVDADDESRDLFHRELAPAGFNTREFVDGKSFVADFYHALSACVLVSAPSNDASEIIAGLADQSSAMPVIVLHAAPSVRETVNLMKVGAFDVLETSIATSDLVKVVRDATARHAKFNEITRGLAQLTERERQVLKLFMQLHSVKEIAKALGISPKTAEKHRANILAKMECDEYTELMLKILSASYPTFRAERMAVHSVSVHRVPAPE